MNENDAEVMVGMLEERGLTRINDESTADLLIYNTCSIRDLAERKVMGKLGKIANTSQRDAIIGITGCMANFKKGALFRKLPHLNFVLGTNNIHDLNSVIDEALSSDQTTIRTDDQFSQELNYLSAKRGDPLKAFVSIIRGCNKFCTYCCVPYTRGQEVSRPPEEIEEEVRVLCSQGYKEITLLGQNVNSYGNDKPEWGIHFHDLLYRLDKIRGIGRVRFMTSHPVDITHELIQAVADLPSLCPFVHFPMQAGSNRILKKMHRIYTIEDYLEKVFLLKTTVPNVALGTDIIVGFPSETAADFEETFQRMKEVEYSWACLFEYSPRKGTPATRWKNDVSVEEKAERLQRLFKLQKGIYAKQRQALIGTTVEVLVEKLTDRDQDYLKGRTPCWKNVVFRGGSHMMGTFQPVTVTGYVNQTLLGDVVAKTSSSGLPQVVSKTPFPKVLAHPVH